VWHQRGSCRLPASFFPALVPRACFHGSCSLGCRTRDMGLERASTRIHADAENMCNGNARVEATLWTMFQRLIQRLAIATWQMGKYRMPTASTGACAYRRYRLDRWEILCRHGGRVRSRNLPTAQTQSGDSEHEVMSTTIICVYGTVRQGRGMTCPCRTSFNAWMRVDAACRLARPSSSCFQRY
jgi:hypothetical protein